MIHFNLSSIMCKHLYLSIVFIVMAFLTACSNRSQSVEMGPYTISTIDPHVYHIQDFNSSYPGGELFDEQGKLTHFNNCSDIYLIVGEEKALLIDLSNQITWADSAEVYLRQIVEERIDGKPLTITFTHNHGDHLGMLPAFVDTDVHFALPQKDFADLKSHFPENKCSLYDEGERFELGGVTVEAIAVPGHTAGSMVFYMHGRDILFTGDAIGSGHGVWIFNETCFDNYLSAVPHLIAWLKNPEHQVNLDKLRIYGGHYWQRDWLTELGDKELGMDYLYDMQHLLNEMEKGTAQTTPSGLNHPVLDTYFRFGSAILVWNAEQAEQYRNAYPETFVYRDEDVVFRQIDEHTWVGNGHLVYNESIYLIEGEERALLIDAGTVMPNLDKAVATLTDKPIMLALTHIHGDHAGGVSCFPEIWINPADTVLIAGQNPYKGTINYLSDGEIIDLGGRQIEVMFTPAHSPGSTTFFDKERRYGFSGDAFGSTNLLLFTGTFKELITTTTRTSEYMQKHGIEKLYPGHYRGNPETLQRILDEKKMAEEVLSGKRKGIKENGNSGLNSYIYDYGVYIRYNDPEALR